MKPTQYMIERERQVSFVTWAEAEDRVSRRLRVRRNMRALIRGGKVSDHSLMITLTQNGDGPDFSIRSCTPMQYWAQASLRTIITIIKEGEPS